MLPTMFRGDLHIHSGQSGLVLRTGPLGPSPERRPRWSPRARIISVRRLHRGVFQTFAFHSRDLKVTISMLTRPKRFLPHFGYHQRL